MLQREDLGQVTLLGSDYVSAKVGGELAEQGGLGMLVALGIIMVYIAVRFQFKFSVGAVVALAHDLIITLGIFSVFQMEFNLNTLAAMLAIIGYSLNDTIVVSRPNKGKLQALAQGPYRDGQRIPESDPEQNLDHVTHHAAGIILHSIYWW